MIQKLVAGQRQPLAYSLFSLCISLVLAVVFCVVYSKQTADDSARSTEQKLCRLVLVLDTAYNERPPSSEAGRNVAGSVHELRMNLRCNEK